MAMDAKFSERGERMLPAREPFRQIGELRRIVDRAR
jgi:hypothetical protein